MHSGAGRGVSRRTVLSGIAGSLAAAALGPLARAATAPEKAGAILKDTLGTECPEARS